MDTNDLMTEEEFARELKGSLLVLTTSSPDKRDIYRLLFSSHAKGGDHHAGLNLYYTDSGALGIAPRKTPEQEGVYAGNLDEKATQQIAVLQDPNVQENIRLKLMAGGNKEFDSRTINIIGMTEDSGWKLSFDNPELEQRFVDSITQKLTPKLRGRDYWLLRKLHETGFPGPNLKPLQEHLEGGFNELMQMIYEAAEELHIKELRFANSTNVSFVSPRSGKQFSKTFESTGRMLTKAEYQARLMGTQRGDAINSNFVHIPDGQPDSAQKTIDVLIREGLHSKSSADLPAHYARRDLTEYLQHLVGKRRSSGRERKRPVNIAFVTPDSMHGAKKPVIVMPIINDLKTTALPTHAELLHSPHIKSFDDAHVVVLIPETIDRRDNHLRADPNLGMLLSFIVTTETDPESMGVPIVLDNRSGGFNKALELISDAFAQGRLMGDTPFYVANTDGELEEFLRLIKDVKQRAPIIETVHAIGEHAVKKPIEKAPHDDVFTVFIGGGHANNSRRDLEDAQALGYLCAENGWRIVTGAGSVEGSMGAVHTGFVQYYLDQLQEKPGLETIKNDLSEFLNGHLDERKVKYDAERIILERPDLIEDLAKKGHIPRCMFYGYSMKPLLEMESPSGNPPPGITYYDAGNRTRRLAGLLAPGTKIFMPGSIGTDEEFEETVKQHIEARVHKKNGAANDTAFSDGTPNEEGTIIIYNRNGHLDQLLRNYGVSAGKHSLAVAKRELNNIRIVTSLDELKEAVKSTSSTWLARVKDAQSHGQDGVSVAAAV